jgi:hypothetical protein
MPHVRNIAIGSPSPLRGRAAEVARLHAEPAALRQWVAELERLVAQLKRRLWPTA